MALGVVLEDTPEFALIFICACLHSGYLSRMGQHEGERESQGTAVLEIPALAWCKLLRCKNTRLGAGSGLAPALCWESGAQRRGRSD